MTLIQRLIEPGNAPRVTITNEVCKVCRGTGSLTVFVKKGIEERIDCPHCRGTGKVLD